MALTPPVLGGGLVLLLVLHQVVMRSATLWRSTVVFWGLVGLLVGSGLGVALFGFPGTEQFPVVRVLLGLIFVLRGLQAMLLRNQRLQMERHEAMLVEEAARLAEEAGRVDTLAERFGEDPDASR